MKLTKLVNRRQPGVVWVFSEITNDYSHTINGNSYLSAELIRDNNRGWTFRDYLLTGRAVNLFCAREEWEPFYAVGHKE